MELIDRLPRAWRDLVNEYGWIVVRDMRLDGYRDAAKLLEELIVWRERQQEAWLNEIPYRRRGNSTGSIPQSTLQSPPPLP